MQNLNKYFNTIKKGKHFHGFLFFASWILSFIACSLFFISNVTSAQWDLLQQAFETANSHELLIDLGNTKEAVGNEVLREGQNVTISFDEGISVETITRPPLIVRIAKFLLRMTVVLSVTMILYNGVYYIIEASKGWDVKEASNNLIYVVVGVLLALFSLAIINLISSISISSLF